VLVVKTDEELMIANAARAAVNGHGDEEN